MPAPLLRLRSDEQLVALFRAGQDEAFRAIHDRYHKRLFAYTRQMLPGRQDAEDALQDVFVRAYAGLRASEQQLALRAWLFRVAHNRCIDELRRPAPPPPEVLQLVRSTVHDPVAEVDLRESLRRLIEDIRRLPEQQRSALLMRELAGMSYADLSASLGISVGAVKSLLVRARVALAQAAEARDTSCLLVREQLVEAHDRGIRPNANARKHMRDCVGCKSFRRELRGMSRQLAGISPTVGPLGVLAKLGFSGGAGGSAAGGGGLALLGGGGAASAGGLAVGINHVAALLVAAAATAGGAAALQHTIGPSSHHPAHARAAATRPHTGGDPLALRSSATGLQAIAGAVEATVSTAPKLAARADASAGRTAKAAPLSDPLGGGPVNAPVTGAASLPAVSRTKASETSSGAAGLQGGSKTTSTSDSCSTATAADLSAANSTSTASTTSTSSTATVTAPVLAGSATAPASEIPCLTPTPVRTDSTATTSAGSATPSSGTGSSTTSSSNTAGSGTGAAPASGSAPSGSSPSGSSGGSSASASK